MSIDDEQKLMDLENKCLILKKRIEKLESKPIDLKELKASENSWILKSKLTQELVDIYKEICQLS
jgi:hypothetical protein